MSKTFSHAGISTYNGHTKVRFANDEMRVKVLAKGGHKDIDIVQLKHPMTKEDAVRYLRDMNFANGNPVVQAALDAAAEKRGVIEKPKKERKTKTVAVAAPVATDAAAVVAPVTVDEDAPF